jgi:hypothetical protein
MISPSSTYTVVVPVISFSIEYPTLGKLYLSVYYMWFNGRRERKIKKPPAKPPVDMLCPSLLHSI